jgi:hypothetical protein
VNPPYRFPLRPHTKLRIIVLGGIVRWPMGGIAWHHLQYVMGFARLGHDVFFFEDSGDGENSCYDPSRFVTGPDPTYGLDFAARVFERVELGTRWAYHDAHTSRWFGPAAGRISEICTSADLLLNLSEANPIRPWLEAVPARVLVDTDPGFNQIHHLTDPTARALAEQHTSFLTFGENFGKQGNSMPDDGFHWQATRQPIVLDAWPATTGRPNASYTTVMQWDSYPAVEYGGQRYGMKSDSFGPYMDLPTRVSQTLELALGTPHAPRKELAGRGWILRDPFEPTRDPWSYQRYIQESKGEFSVAKQAYVETRSGWFSERSAAYLASGRPVIVQETGFSDWLAPDRGILPFRSPGEAIDRIKEVECDYSLHCRAAREIAEEYFDSAKVLSSLIERATTPFPAHIPQRSTLLTEAPG